MYILDRRVDEGSSVYSQFSSLKAVIGSRAINLSSVSALTFLAWDIVLTFDDEVRLIWPSTFNTMKCVYFVTRYLSLLGQIPLLFVGSELSPFLEFTPKECFLWQVYQGVLASLVIMAVDIILIVRVRAMYSGHPFIPRITAVVFFLEIVAMGLGLGLSLPGFVMDNLCIVLHIPYALGIYCLGSTIFQTAVFALTVYKFFQDVKQYGGWKSRTRLPLTFLLLRDGTWAFIVLFCVYIGQVALYVAQTPGAVGILFPWMLTLCSFCGYRIMLNLRWFAVDNLEERNANLAAQQVVQYGDEQAEERIQTVT